MSASSRHSVVRNRALFTLEARRLLASGRAAEAAEICRRGLIHFPEDHTGYVVLAQALMNQGHHDRALQVLTDGYTRTGSARLRTLRGTLASKHIARARAVAETHETSPSATGEQLSATENEQPDIESPAALAHEAAPQPGDAVAEALADAEIVAMREEELLDAISIEEHPGTMAQSASAIEDNPDENSSGKGSSDEHSPDGEGSGQTRDDSAGDGHAPDADVWIAAHAAVGTASTDLQLIAEAVVGTPEAEAPTEDADAPDVLDTATPDPDQHVLSVPDEVDQFAAENPVTVTDETVANLIAPDAGVADQVVPDAGVADLIAPDASVADQTLPDEAVLAEGSAPEITAGTEQQHEISITEAPPFDADTMAGIAVIETAAAMPPLNLYAADIPLADPVQPTTDTAPVAPPAPAEHGRERGGLQTLVLHSVKSVSRLRSSNLRLIPGLEFAPLRHEEPTRRQSIAPLISEPMPQPEAPRRRLKPLETGSMPPLPPLEGHTPLEATETLAQDTAIAIAPPAAAEAAPASTLPEPVQPEQAQPEQTQPEQALPEQAQPEPIQAQQQVAHRAIMPESPADRVLRLTTPPIAPAPAEERSPIEELARRLENARIPAVEETEQRTAFQPSMVSDTLANILVAQGAYAEARKAFETLARAKPEHGAYYQEKIAEMDRHLNSDASDTVHREPEHT